MKLVSIAHVTVGKDRDGTVTSRRGGNIRVRFPDGRTHEYDLA